MKNFIKKINFWKIVYFVTTKDMPVPNNKKAYL